MHESFIPPQQTPETHAQPALQTGGPPSNDLNNAYQYNNGHLQTQTYPQTATSPNFTFSPLQETVNLAENGKWDPFYGAQGVDQQTPGGLSQSAESAHTDMDKDPFLSLLEQLAQNDGSANGGPSDLDFFLNSQT